MWVVPLVRGEPAAQKKGNISQMSRHVRQDGKGVNQRVVDLAITKSTQLTPVQASNTYIQMSGDSGFRKEKTPGLVPLGLRYRMLIPRVMKGLEKSMTFSLTYVMVRGATARSATWKSKIMRTEQKETKISVEFVVTVAENCRALQICKEQRLGFSSPAARHLDQKNYSI